VRICVLDDYEQVALDSADWSSLPAELCTVLDYRVSGPHLVELLHPFDVVVLQRERTPITRALLAQLPNLRLVVTTGERNSAVDLEACRQLGVTVSATTTVGNPVVELAWALILAGARDLVGRASGMPDGRWEPRPGRALEGRLLGLLGLGRTGTRMARIARAFDMQVIAWSENLTPEAAEAAGARRVTKQRLFAESDVVSVHLLLSSRTQGLVGAPDLALMKQDAWLVNTSRGPIVDEQALLVACRSETIAGAALDVYEEEPLPADHPLRRLPNVILTPHIGYVTRECLEHWYTDAVESVAAWAAGAPIRLLT
jgi:phosphoglycerate dehydrogenase-like enzyme